MAVLFCVIGNLVPITQKRSAWMRTAAYNADVASDRRRRKNVPRHILCSVTGNFVPITQNVAKKKYA